MESAKERIVEHAADLFSKKGVKTLTMDDIASSLGMSKRTIYENFANKNELIQACLDYFFEQQDKNIKNVLKSSENIMDAMFKQMQCNTRVMGQVKFDFFNEIRRYYPEVYHNTVSIRKEQSLENSIEMLQKGQKDGVIRTDRELDVRLMAILMHEVANILMIGTAFDEYDIDKKELLGMMMYNLCRGMATDKGVKILDELVAKVKSKNII